MSDFIYRYRPINSFSIRELAEGSCYFASPSQFNDPFDCQNLVRFDALTHKETQDLLSRYLSQWKMSQADRDAWLEYLTKGNPSKRRLTRLADFEEHLKMLIDGYGVLCLSEKSDDILMWSHYADSHKGMCLVFEEEAISKRFICHSVKYKNNYPRFKDCLTNQGRINLGPIFLTKSKHWAYEKEVRLLVEAGFIPESGSGRCLEMPLGALVGIIFGCQTTSQDKEIIKEIVKNKKGIKFWEARKSLTAYSLIINQEAPILSWEQLGDLPDAITLDYNENPHPSRSIPSDVISEYERLKSLGDVVVWATAKYCGIKIEKFECMWTPEELQEAKLCTSPEGIAMEYRGKKDLIFVYKHDDMAAVNYWIQKFTSTVCGVMNVSIATTDAIWE